MLTDFNKMSYSSEYYNKICLNCRKRGHNTKYCNEPKTSYGVINFDIIGSGAETMIIREKFSTKKNMSYKIVSNKHPKVNCLVMDGGFHEKNNKYLIDTDVVNCSSEDEMRKFCYYKDKIIFMMISRRFSIGFIEFIRGKYNVRDPNSVINLFRQMYTEEITFITKNSYDNILYHFSNRNNKPKEIVLSAIYEGKYAHEYCEAKTKFNILQSDNDIPYGLHFYAKYIKPSWKYEWGFPKGRLDNRSEEIRECAKREFEEETGYTKDDYVILDKIAPINEIMTGTNKKKYKHTYYMSINHRDPELDLTGYDEFETGEIRWFTYDEAIAIIRPYHIEKKNVLTRVYLFILNYLIHNNCDLITD